MLKPQGFVSVIGYDVLERDTITCGHCNQIVMVKPGSATTVYYIPQLVGPPKEEPGAGCYTCGKPICLTCYDEGRCTPLERRIEQMEVQGLRNKALAW